MSNFTISKFQCTQCSSTIFLPRKKSKQKERDHLKKIYCIECRDEINHKETREFDWEAPNV
jgi:ribosomal protein L33